jgi:acyl carrier protein
MATTMTKERLEERVFEALVEFGAERDEIALDARLEDLDIDSLDLVELAQIVDDEFGVAVDGRDMEGVRTVGDALDRIAAKA